MKGFYKNNGELEVSDEGKQVEEIENKLDFDLLIEKLPEKDKQIAIMLSQGYTLREIKKELKVGASRIYNIGNKLDKNMVE